MKTLITDVAGFIGMHSAVRLLDGDGEVIGVNNPNEYCDVNLKRDRLSILQKYQNVPIHQADINDNNRVDNLSFAIQPRRVINLAAEVGVRNSVTNPYAYVETNIKGFMNVLEGCWKLAVGHSYMLIHLQFTEHINYCHSRNIIMSATH